MWETVCKDGCNNTVFGTLLFRPFKQLIYFPSLWAKLWYLSNKM